MTKLKILRIFFVALGATLSIMVIKFVFHQLNIEIIEQTSLHNSLISSVIFVIGFLLSATIADYKESEKIPAEFASTVENMYEDARSMHLAYSKFDLERFRGNLLDILGAFRDGTRVNRSGVRREINELNIAFVEMEKVGVPANYIVKLKQQQAQLLRSMFRVNYIQKIKFIPSAFILARSIVGLVIIVLLLTNIDPFYGGLVLTGAISFILLYMIVLIQTISIPFHAKGKTQDDVSLFLLQETAAYLRAQASKKER